MSDPLAALRALADSAITARQRQANENRARFPHTAATVDELRKVFGEVKVIHAIENGHEVGKPDETGWVRIPQAGMDAGIRRAEAGRRKSA